LADCHWQTVRAPTTICLTELFVVSTYFKSNRLCILVLKKHRQSGEWRHDSQHNDIQHEATQHNNNKIYPHLNGTQCCYAEFCRAVSNNAQRCYAEWRYTECHKLSHYAQCRYAECRYPDCHGAWEDTASRNLSKKFTLKF
jgi:hypothetical protein